MSLRTPADESREWLAGLLLIPTVLASVYLYHRLGERVLGFDALTLFAPYFSLVADFARSGQFLLWNPWSNCGSPDVAYVEMGSFSPLTLLVAWATGGGDTGFLVYWLTIWGVGGVGLVCLGRHLGAPIWGALTVTVAFLFSGFYLGDATHTSWLYGFSFLPFLIWRLDEALIRGARWPALEAGALYGLSALAGHPALVILNGLYMGMWALGRVFCRDDADPRRAVGGAPARAGRLVSEPARAVRALAMVLAVAVVILSPTYAAFFAESAGYADRAVPLGRDVAVAEQALPPRAITTFASPYLSILATSNPRLWGDTWMGLTCLYTGGFVPAVALMMLLLRPRSRWHWWLVAMAAFSLACAVGPVLPVRGWLYDLFYPSRYFRHSAVMRAHFLFSLCVLALLGTKHLSGGEERDLRPWRYLFGTSLALLFVSLAAYGTTLRSVADWGEHATVANLHFALTWLGMPALCLIAWRRRKIRWPVLLPGAFLVYVLCDAGFSFFESAPMISYPRETYSRLRIPLRERSVARVADGFLRRRYPPGQWPPNFNLYDKTALLENFNTLNNRFHTSRATGRVRGSRLSTSWADEPVLAAAVIGERSRFWFAPVVAEVPLSDANFLAFVSRARALRSVPLVVHRREDMAWMARSAKLQKGAPRGGDEVIAELPAAIRVDVRLLRYSPTEMSFELTSPADGWLLVTDRWARGWRAMVDGVAAIVWGGDFIFRALPVRAGVHRVEFHYRPFGYPCLLLLSWTCLGVIGAGSIRRLRRAGNPARSPYKGKSLRFRAIAGLRQSVALKRPDRYG